MIFKGEKLFDVSFDKYAESYDEVRPKYPTELLAHRMACIQDFVIGASDDDCGISIQLNKN